MFLCLICSLRSVSTECQLCSLCLPSSMRPPCSFMFGDFCVSTVFLENNVLGEVYVSTVIRNCVHYDPSVLGVLCQQ